MQKVIDYDGHKHVEFEIPLRSRYTYRHVVSNNLHGDHGQRFALSRIYLPWHYRRTRFVFGNRYFPQSATRPRSEPAHVVCYLHKVGGERFQRPVCEHERVFTRKRVEFIRFGNELFARYCAYVFGDFFRKTRGRVEPRSHRRTAQSKAGKFGKSENKHFLGFNKHRFPAAYFLRKGDGHGVLQMRSAALYNALIFLL